MRNHQERIRRKGISILFHKHKQYHKMDIEQLVESKGAIRKHHAINFGEHLKPPKANPQ